MPGLADRLLDLLKQVETPSGWFEENLSYDNARFMRSFDRRR